MSPLAVIVVRAGGAGRAALVAGSTALASGLLLVALAIVRFDGSDSTSWEHGHVFAPIQDPGTRPGVVLAVVLMVLPLLLLLDQAVRLGSTGRQRRYAALAVAGATRADVRRWAAVEVGLPATAGAVLGVPVWLLLRELLGAQLARQSLGALVPVTTGPGAWAVLVVAAVAAYGVFVGRRSGSQMSEALAGSRGVQRPPRPWAALLLVAAGLVLALGYAATYGASEVVSFALTIGGVLCAVGGMAGLAPWAAHRTALALSGRVRTGAGLLATGRLAADPRPAGRAAAAVGAVALTGGVLGAFVADVLRSTGSDAQDHLQPAAVAGGCAVVAVLVIATSLVVHSTETVVERRRAMAALVATGVPPAVISSAQRLEGLIATLPLTVAGSLLGGFGYGGLGGLDASMVLWILAATAVTTAVVLAAVWAATGLLRPWVLDAVDPEQLRTE